VWGGVFMRINLMLEAHALELLHGKAVDTLGRLHLIQQASCLSSPSRRLGHGHILIPEADYGHCATPSVSSVFRKTTCCESVLHGEN
jgi:hypothetical protein